MGNRGGINRLTAVLLVLIAIMLVLIAIPSYRVFQYRAQKTSCEQAMKSARDGLIIEYLSRWDEGTVEDAIKTLDEVLPERPNICPAGGTVYLIKNSLGIFEPVCGLHDTDRRLRCRLNASRAMELLGTALNKARKSGEADKEAMEITLNSKPLECVRVAEKLELRRGTATTNGYKGVVAFYGIEGEGFKTGKVKKGEICYFVYADEDNASVWLAGDGWTGSAYQGMEKK
ncbi:MAG: hypothetical protein IJH86_01355 [Clostridia bacterium]|nr:hypothetical protein [Clostridia bacterium]